MNLQDRTMKILLTLKDRILNLLTFGRWERVRGEKRVNVYRVKRS